MENREWEFSAKLAKNQNQENQEMETETKSGNWVGILACKVKFRLMDKSSDNLLLQRNIFQACS